jgi:neural Wiskott-Aldrich syndrome protein
VRTKKQWAIPGKVNPSMSDTSKTIRSFQCRDALWEKFEQMARELECSVDYLINDSMKQYARQRGYGSTRGGGLPAPSRTSLQPPAQPQSNTPALAPGAGAPVPMPPPPGVPHVAPMPPHFAASHMPVPPPPSMGMTPMGTPVVGTPPSGVAIAPGGPPPAPRQRSRTPGFGGAPPHPGSVSPLPPPLPPPMGGQMPPMPPSMAGGMGGPIPGAPPLPGSMGGQGFVPQMPPAPGRPRSMAPPPSAAAPPPPRMAGPPRRAINAYYMGQRYTVTKDRFIIGRGKQSSDLTIKDPNVSRQHALVEFMGGQYFMVDMGSTNGVEYMGQRVARHPIAEGDVFRVCDHELRFSYY